MFEYDLTDNIITFYKSQGIHSIIKEDVITNVKELIETGKFIHLDDIPLFNEIILEENNTLDIHVYNNSNEWD